MTGLSGAPCPPSPGLCANCHCTPTTPSCDSVNAQPPGKPPNEFVEQTCQPRHAGMFHKRYYSWHGWSSGTQNEVTLTPLPQGAAWGFARPLLYKAPSPWLTYRAPAGGTGRKGRRRGDDRDLQLTPSQRAHRKPNVTPPVSKHGPPPPTSVPNHELAGPVSPRQRSFR